MPQGDKSARNEQARRKAGPIEKAREQKDTGRPGSGARAWAAADKLQGAGKKINSRAKVPFGPVGGSGRKTNLSRSS